MRQKLSKVSANYLITRTSAIFTLVPPNEVAYHAGRSHWGALTNLNDKSIGIEFEHVDGKQDWPAAQVQAGAILVKALRYRYGIPVEKVVGHSDIAPGRKVDPVGFPWEHFRDMVK